MRSIVAKVINSLPRVEATSIRPKRRNRKGRIARQRQRQRQRLGKHHDRKLRAAVSSNGRRSVVFQPARAPSSNASPLQQGHSKAIPSGSAISTVPIETWKAFKDLREHLKSIGHLKPYKADSPVEIESHARRIELKPTPMIKFYYFRYFLFNCSFVIVLFVQIVVCDVFHETSGTMCDTDEGACWRVIFSGLFRWHHVRKQHAETYVTVYNSRVVL